MPDAPETPPASPLEIPPRTPPAAEAGDPVPAAGPAAASARPSSLGALRALFERHDLAVVALASLALLLPGLWAYQLIDPWETHYGEVARRMLQGHDWVFLHWQNEGFRSKPVLTFWLIAASMKLFGIAQDGGYSGEMVSSDLVMFAVRLPFALFGVLGLTLLWWMLARLVSRRIAWLAFAITATCPMYCMVARQAITDMPLVAALMGAIACFAMATHAGDEPIAPLYRRGRVRLDAHHVFLLVLSLFVLWQALYYLLYFHAYSKLAPGVRVWQPGLLLCGGMVLCLAGFAVWSLFLQPTRTRGQVWMYWFYVLIGVSVLGKGPPGIGLAGLICFLFLALTGRWRLIRVVEIPRGLLLTALIAVPWHLAMWFKDGRGWAREYFIYHMLERVAEGVHGERGTFDYYSSVLGVGMWPWIALLPAALYAVVARRQDAGTREGHIRLLVGIWAIAGAGLFAITKTKFHHYILPVVPAFAVLIAFWIDDVLRGRGGRVAPIARFGAVLALLVTRDLVGEPKQLIELFIYRYDRPWPSGAPWFVDVSGPIVWFGLAAAGALLLFSFRWRRLRAVGLGGLFAAALGFSLWASNGYMAEAAPHWGQRNLIHTYYRMRQIHGLEIKYWTLRDVADEWGGAPRDVEVRTVLPEGFRTGLPMRVRLLVPGAGVPGDALELHGLVSAVGDDRFSIAIPPAERAKIAGLVARGRKLERGNARRPWRQVDADRLLAWQLYWRGENFWTADEIWGETDDTQTAFKQVDNKAFLTYLKAPARQNRTFYVVTEAGRANGLKNVLPSKRGKETVAILDTSSNKFTLLRFSQ